jgi:predicted TIM-barrel fold metal-dependent hydrolase
VDEPTTARHMLDVLEWVGTDRIMFSTDYPHWDFDDPDQTLRTLPAEWREPIRHGTAAELFGVPVSAPA